MKKIWLIITSLIITALLVNVISADSEPTYKETSTACEIIAQTKYGTTNYNYYVQTNTTARGTILQRNTDWTIYIVSLSPFTVKAGDGGCNNTYNISTPNTYGNVQFYIFEYSAGRQLITHEYPLIQVNVNKTYQLAYRYTYGDLSIDPVNEIEYTELIIDYSQNIITSGNGASNEDIIRWNAYRDTAGNDIQGKNIEIQAIAGYFQGSSYADLKTNNFTDWLNATHQAVTMYKGSIEKSYEVYQWGEVATNFRDINTLGMWFWNIFTSEETWYQYGWRYQARLLDEELEPLTEWQLIYTGNSYTPSATETLTDDEPLSPDDVDTINDINNENDTTNNWYINNTYVTNNEYNQTYQQNIIENIYNVITGTPDPEKHQKANDIQQTIDNAINTEDDYLNDLSSQLTDLELPNISEQTGLLKALRWVREVHKETIEETLLAPIILIILTIGLITYLIGRRNG